MVALYLFCFSSSLLKLIKTNIHSPSKNNYSTLRSASDQMLWNARAPTATTSTPSRSHSSMTQDFDPSPPPQIFHSSESSTPTDDLITSNTNLTSNLQTDPLGRGSAPHQTSPTPVTTPNIQPLLIMPQQEQPLI